LRDFGVVSRKVGVVLFELARRQDGRAVAVSYFQACIPREFFFFC
jgi:hypothetical protein